MIRRVRLYGGRNMHEAQPSGSGFLTACAIYISATAHNHWHNAENPDNAEPVTCRSCIKALARKESV